MVFGILFNILGMIIFLFLFWKKLKEDYISAQIFSSAFFIIAGIVVFYLISKLYLPSWWFWFSLLGFLIGFVISTLKFGLRIYETLEASFISILPWISFLYLNDSIKNTSWISLLAFAFTLGIVFLYIFLNSKYKNFSWYKSGRVGFAGLTSMGIYFLIRGLIAIFFPFVVSFVVDYEPILSGSLAFSFFLLVFNLSRKSQ